MFWLDTKLGSKRRLQDECSRTSGKVSLVSPFLRLLRLDERGLWLQRLRVRSTAGNIRPLRIPWRCIPLFISAFGATAVTAQGGGTHPQYGVGLGRSIPTGAFRSDTTGEGFAGGWAATAHVTLQPLLRLQRFRLRIDATYAKNGANDRLKANLTNAFGQASDERMTLLGANASVTYPVATAWRFASFAFGGLGVWHSTISVSTAGASTHTGATKLAWQLGGEVTLGRLFLELRYVSVAAATGYPGTSFIPLTFGIHLGKRAR